MNIRIATLISTLVILISCKSGDNHKTPKPPLSFVSATQSEWTAGIPQGGHGTEYTFTVIANSEDIRCDSAWVNEQRLSIKTFKGLELVKSSDQFTKGDTLRLRCTSRDNSIKATSPADYETGQALVRAYKDTTPYYLLITDIETLKKTPRP